jgi:hypothetical protein
MKVQIGTTHALDGGQLTERDAPSVAYLNLHDYSHNVGSLDPKDVKDHLADALLNRRSITRLGAENEGLLAVIHPDGFVRSHSGTLPTWIHSDDDVLAEWLGRYYGVPVLGADQLVALEDTHWTQAGPPGVVPGAATDLSMQITSNGRDIVARNLGGFGVGAAGKGTAASATSLTTASTFVTNQFVGYRIVVADTTNNQCVWGNITGNTNASGASVVSVDQWYNAGAPGGVAATTPAAGFEFLILDGGAPAWFVGLSASSTAAAGSPPDSHTSLTSEITTSGGGLIRKIAPWAHTAGTNTWTLVPVFTANGSDALPVTVSSYGVFDSMVAGTAAAMLYYNTISPSATLAAAGDQLTLTITCTTT